MGDDERLLNLLGKNSINGLFWFDRFDPAFGGHNFRVNCPSAYVDASGFVHAEPAEDRVDVGYVTGVASGNILVRIELPSAVRRSAGTRQSFMNAETEMWLADAVREAVPGFVRGTISEVDDPVTARSRFAFGVGKVSVVVVTDAGRYLVRIPASALELRDEAEVRAALVRAGVALNPEPNAPAVEDYPRGSLARFKEIAGWIADCARPDPLDLTCALALAMDEVATGHSYDKASAQARADELRDELREGSWQP